MITIKNITLRNFLSIGNVTQAVDFDKKDITLILGENLDLGGDGARNGTGKTTLIQGLSYALFGVPINSIRKDNLVNRTNGKGMLVTLEFNVNGTEYKIERGRKPNVLKFYVNDVQQKATEDQQGENKETQAAIERVLNMSPEMFKHIVVLNTYSEPFLALKNNEQKDIIEQLLGITLLSEKAEVVKDLIRQSKDDIQQEEFRIKAVEEANKRVKEQIDSVRRRQTLWQRKHDEDLSFIATEYDELSKVDIDTELQAHKDLVVWNSQKQQQEAYEALIARQTAWMQKQDKDIATLKLKMDELSHIDFVHELQAHTDLAVYNQQVQLKTAHDSKVDSLRKDITKESKNYNKLTQEVDTLKEHKCYACGQDFHDDQHTSVLNSKIELWNTSKSHLDDLRFQLDELVANPIVVGDKPVTHYKTEVEAVRQSTEIDNIKKQIDEKSSENNPFSEQLFDTPSVTLGSKPSTHYDTEAQAVEHRTKISNLLSQIENKAQETDPYQEQILEMEAQALQEINFDTINNITKAMEHQKFLLDLLTSKDSFVRKKIIDQNLSYLNARLTHYLDKIGLPHNVVFKNDLTVEITELGRELDFDNLSRGERNRLILGLSFAFRDVWENLYAPVNTLFIDELIDSGLDTMGVENSLAILKDMSRRRHKSIWLVSHREELAGRVPNVLKVIKENGFTSYSNDSEISDVRT
jgi:DNA repair exonuclease SbcCD ATPase subunit